MLRYKDIQSFFFLGIGGIGMSALARYFHQSGFRVSGYDRTSSMLTNELQEEGITVTYEDLVPESLKEFGAREFTQIVLTPAVPSTCQILQWLQNEGFDIAKRSEILGETTRQMKALCVAGTHGKTTTSTMLAHIMYQSEIGTNAFLGGISNNYQQNLLICRQSSYVVVEADEYDRSFLQLRPYMSVITSVEADHLDIYGTAETYKQAFEQYTALINNTLIIKQGLKLQPQMKKGARIYTYGIAQTNMPLPDFYADNIRTTKKKIVFDFHTPTETIPNITLNIPIMINVENSVAAMTMAWLNGVTGVELWSGLNSFSGVYRRFNILYNSDHLVYVDDYAHHPSELRAAINGIRTLFSDASLITVFQPHLYTRTRDFADDFAQTLSLSDEIVLLPIYPAREEKIEGVDSQMLLEKITLDEKSVVEKADLCSFLQQRLAENTDHAVVILTVGAGDIDRLTTDIVKMLRQR